MLDIGFVGRLVAMIGGRILGRTIPSESSVAAPCAPTGKTRRPIDRLHLHWVLIAPLIGGCATGPSARGDSPEISLPAPSRSRAADDELARKLGASVLAWCFVEQAAPSECDYVPDVMRRAIAETGLPWKIVHKHSGQRFVLIPPMGRIRTGDMFEEEDFFRRTEVPPRPLADLLRTTVEITQPFYFASTELSVKIGRGMGLEPKEDDPAVDRAPNSVFYRPEYPIVDVSYADARRMTNDRNMRISTQEEWLYVAGLIQMYYPELIHRDVNVLDSSSDENDKDIGDLKLRPDQVGRDGFPGVCPVHRCGLPLLGIHGMFGNVREICADMKVDSSLLSKVVVKWPAQNFENGVAAHGGNYRHGLDQSTPWLHDLVSTEYSSDNLGFRLVWVIDPTVE